MTTTNQSNVFVVIEKMTKKEAAHIAKLEAENIQLREQIEKHMKIYRDQLYEIVDLRMRLNVVSGAMDGYEVMP